MRDCPGPDTPAKQCPVARDGFYTLSAACIACGAAVLLWLWRALPALEALPLSAWHARLQPGKAKRKAT